MLAGVAFAAFLWVESRLAEPMMPLSLFRIRELSVANLATFFVYAALGSALFFVALFAQSVLGYSPTEAGLLFVPVSIVLWAPGRSLRPLGRPLGPRPFLIGGPALIAVGLAWLGLLEPGANYWIDVFPPLLVFSLGLAATVPAITSTALKPAPEGLTGVASGINTTVSRLGQLVAVAALGVVVSFVYSARGRPVRARRAKRRRSSRRPPTRSRRRCGSRPGWPSPARSSAAWACLGELEAKRPRALPAPPKRSLPRLPPLGEDREPVARRVVRALLGQPEPGTNEDLQAVLRLGHCLDERVLEHAHDVGDRDAARRAGRPRPGPRRSASANSAS